MLDGQVSLLTLAAARYFALNEIPPRLGTEHPGRVPSATFRCKDGKYAHITASDQHWAPLCSALGLEDWGTAFSDNAVRVEKRDEVMRVLTEKIAKLERAKLLAMLDEVDVPVGPVNDVAEILADPHVRARAPGRQLRLSRAWANSRRSRCRTSSSAGTTPRSAAPPALGEHTESVLAECWAFGEKIAELKAAKAI